MCRAVLEQSLSLLEFRDAWPLVGELCSALALGVLRRVKQEMYSCHPAS
jgi:hypothetical protein